MSLMGHGSLTRNVEIMELVNFWLKTNNIYTVGPTEHLPWFRNITAQLSAPTMTLQTTQLSLSLPHSPHPFPAVVGWRELLEVRKAKITGWIIGNNNETGKWTVTSTMFMTEGTGKETIHTENLLNIRQYRMVPSAIFFLTLLRRVSLSPAPAMICGSTE